MRGVIALRFKEVPPPPSASWTRAFITDTGCSVLVAVESGRWHLSIAHPDRYPTWDEIREARYALVPNHVTMAMLLPPRQEYVNIHPHCFHLWEVRDAILRGGVEV
jgi:hypothetical protein